MASVEETKATKQPVGPITIPDGKYAPKPGSSDVERGYVELPPNLAANWKISKVFHDHSFTEFTRVKGQSKREQLEKNMESADAMYRMSKRRSLTEGGSDQQQDTLSNMPSPSYYNAIRTTTAGQKAIFFPEDGTIPAKYLAKPGARDFGGDSQEAERVARGRNIILDNAWADGEWTSTLKRALLYNNKYAQEILGQEWEYETSTRPERVPGYFDKSGKPVELDRKNPPKVGVAYDRDGKPLVTQDAEGNQTTGIIDPETGTPQHFVIIEKTRIVKDRPELSRHDLKDCYYDMQLDDIQQGCFFAIRGQMTLSEIYQKQRDGIFVNADKLSASTLFSNESAYNSEVKQDREDNADEDPETGYTGNIDTMHVWYIAPIDDEYKSGKTDKTRGKWDGRKIEPKWYEAIFAGHFGDMANDSKDVKGGCIPLMLRRNPYRHGRLPYRLIHSHDDDKGALHMGYQTLLESLYEEETVTVDQLIDNKNLGVNRPWIAEKGAVLTRGMKFIQGNQVYFVKQGRGKDALRQVEIKDFTGTALPFLQYINDNFQRTAGTDDPVSGQYAGSRTTSTEVVSVREQAMKPVIEDAEYIADQIFPWLLRDFADLYEQFGDPQQQIYLTGGIGGDSIVPGDLYGDYDIEIVSVGQFVTEVVTKQNLVALVQSGAYDKSAQFLGENTPEFWRIFYRTLKLPQIAKLFKPTRYMEAENQAHSENNVAMNDSAAAMLDLPQQEERHDVHLPIHENFLERYKLVVPKEEQNEETVRALQQQIAIHKQYQAQGLEQMQQGLKAGREQMDSTMNRAQMEAPMNQSATPPEMPGEAAGDTMAGMGAQMAGGGA